MPLNFFRYPKPKRQIIRHQTDQLDFYLSTGSITTFLCKPEPVLIVFTSKCSDKAICTIRRSLAGIGSRETGLPLIIHSRDADEEMIDLLESEYMKEPFLGVMHCFSSSKELAVAALNIGFYISFSGIITFKNADDLRLIAKEVPINKILIETDAPYLAPVPNRGKGNEPSFLIHTAKK